MKTSLFDWRSRFLAIAMVLFTSVAFGAHFRGGSISWSVDQNDPSGRTVIIKVTQSYGGWTFDPWYPVSSTPVGQPINYNFDRLVIASSTNGFLTSLPINQLVMTSFNPTEDYWIGEQLYTYTFPSAGNYQAYFGSCCRVSNLSNNANANWRNSTTIDIGSGNNSPASSVPPVVNLPIGSPSASYQLPVADPDGDQLTFREANPNEAGSGSSNPSRVNISSTGLISFNTVGLSVGQIYNAAFVISDGSAQIMMDIVFKMVQPSNPPIFDYSQTPPNGYVFETGPGLTITFNVRATDPDPGNTVTLSAAGLPGSSQTSPQLPMTATAPQSQFTWTPSAANFGATVINFTAQDNFGNQASSSVTIIVSLKPVFDVPPTPAQGIHNVVEPGTNLTFTVQASDPDPADQVSIIAANGKDHMGGMIPLYAGASVTPLPSPAANPTSAVFSWTPAPSDWGHNHVFFTAEDLSGEQTVHEVSILVNTDPVITSTPSDEAFVGGLYTYAITVNDPDIAFGDAVTINGASGIPSFLTLVDNGNGTATLSGTPALADAGTYMITINAEDANHHQGNMATQTFQLEVIPCNITLGGAVGDVSCNGGNDGSVDLTVTGANGTVTYAWSNGATTEDLTGVPAGTYSVTITDGFSCNESATFTVGEPTPITHSYSATPILCNGGLSTESITVNGGTPPYTVTNQNGGVLVSGLQSGVTANGNTFATTYNYTITDANGCTSSFTAVIPEPSLLTSSLTVTPSIGVNPGGAVNTIFIGYGPQSVTLDAAAAGGTPPYSYAWSNAGSLSSASGASVQASPSSTETYTVTATDANGCTSSQTVTINVVDVRCGKKGRKVLVCKVPPGNPGNAHNICVAPQAVASHLANGSYLGPCANKTGGWTGNEFAVFPNPNRGTFTLSFDLVEEKAVVYQIMDMSGRMVLEGQVDEIAGHYQTQVDMTDQPSGMYMVRFISEDEVTTERVSIQR